jgi:hypothetical protein
LASSSTVYVETHTRARFLELPTEVDEYRHVFTRIHAQSRPISEYRPTGRRT